MRALLLFIALAAFAAACSKSGPPPLTLEEIPAAISKAFQPARLQVKKNAEAVGQQIKDKQFAVAVIQLQALLSNPDLSEEQRNVLSASMTTVNETLQAQAAAVMPEAAPAADGSPKPPVPAVNEEEAKAAAAAVEYYRATK